MRGIPSNLCILATRNPTVTLQTRIKYAPLRHRRHSEHTVAETDETAPSASAAVSGSCSAPSSIFHMRTMQSCPPVKARLEQQYERLAERICNHVRSVFGESQGCMTWSMRRAGNQSRHRRQSKEFAFSHDTSRVRDKHNMCTHTYLDTYISKESLARPSLL